MKGSVIVLGGLLFQQLPARIWGWDGTGDKCDYCSLPRFVRGFRGKRTAGCTALKCDARNNKNMIWRKVRIPMPMNVIHECEMQVANEKSKALEVSKVDKEFA